MADKNKDTTLTPTEQPTQQNTEAQKSENKTNPGTPDPNTFSGAESQAAAKAGLTEGEFKALRHEAGLNQLPGHQANILTWEKSQAGKDWADKEDERNKAAEQEEKYFSDQTPKDGRTEADARYFEAVEGKNVRKD